MKKAVGLKYEPGDNAPKIIGLGQGTVAEKIIDLAQERGIPIIQNSWLTQELTKSELNHEIPPELYSAVAEVLAFIYNTAKDLPQDK